MEGPVQTAADEAAPSGSGLPAEDYPAFSRFAWVVLGYTLFVIAFGAWVRITGSGAGCGEHWPTCHGEVIPRAPETATIIEYTHRLTSGILGPLVVGLLVWARVGAGRRPAVYFLALATVVFVALEALIGAGLVLKGLVADDDSVARATVAALHLGNTFVLTAACALTAWLGRGRLLRPCLRGDAAHLLAAMAFIVVVSMSGAVTALGDTLFPVTPTDDAGVFSRVKDGLDAGAHFLVRLRAVHPLLAVAVGLWVLWLSSNWMSRRGDVEVVRLARLLHLSLWAQLICGVINVMLAAPGWLQLVHLLLAQIVWILMALLFAGSERLAAEVGPGAAGGSGAAAGGTRLDETQSSKVGVGSGVE